MVGQTLGHYRILERLGKGGMGEVYRAEDTTLKRQIALKVLPPDLAGSQERLARFQREAETLAALDHPNIVTIHTVEEADGVHFLTMELVEGTSLRDLLPQEGLPLGKFFGLALPLADALSEAHEQGIVHRDLKPSNVMVDRKARPKILDFGLAKLRESEPSPDISELPTEVMTEEGRVLGTYPYMSPEQVEGKTVDQRSDIFSFGTVLYEMATGSRPFQGDSPVSLMSAILRDMPPAVDKEKQELPHHLGRIIRQCLEKDPEDRFQSIKDVRNELKSLERETESDAISTSRSIVERPGRETRWRWPLITATVIAAVILVSFFLPWGKSNTKQTTPAEVQDPTSEAPIGASAGRDRKMIVVLPFENLGAADDDYFAAGMTEEITSRLAVVSGLGVISRTSATQYQREGKTMREIGSDLGVDYVLEGTVRWAKQGGNSRVRITPQLIEVVQDTQLWADTYDRVIQDIFAVQSEIAEIVIAELVSSCSTGNASRWR